MLENKDISRFFPDVIICMHRPSHDLKLLAYTILLETYSTNKLNALMPINMLQKVISFEFRYLF